jgi:hypothetical protein
MFLTIRALHRWGVRRDLRHKLIKLGVPVCVGCGYLLRGLPVDTPVCPECVRKLDANVRSMLVDHINLESL